LGSDDVGPISITISGSLGVGTENPESTLHVAGRTKTDGDLIVSANAMVGGSVLVNRDLAVNGSTTVENLDVAGRIALKVTTDASGATDYAHIYSKDVSNMAEIFVRDEAGNVTQISPHNPEGEWQYFSRNTRTGKVVKVNMEKMIRRLEEITGESFMEEWYEDPTT
jgi:cytoskeletal protein CcmA (bactofilin family)